MKKNKRGQILRSKEERRALLDEYGTSGQRLPEFCRRKGISVSTVHSWLRTERDSFRKKRNIEAGSSEKLLRIIPTTSMSSPGQQPVGAQLMSISLNLGTVLSFEYRREQR